ncbi:MAG: hypothetical protein HY770_05530 [Chitinivibrionia bacterium]|nr:hypothetical protein [Chitinivibrionia bacterium]
MRVSRNCPWNRCSFCPVYKSEKFSVRSAANIKKDIDLLCKHAGAIRQSLEGSNGIEPEAIRRAFCGASMI